MPHFNGYTPTPWTPQAERIVTKLWGTQTAEIIAQMLGPRFTRNSVVGKAARLGLRKLIMPHIPRVTAKAKPREKKNRSDYCSPVTLRADESPITPSPALRVPKQDDGRICGAWIRDVQCASKAVPGFCMCYDCGAVGRRMAV